jgi:HSP20 family protein
MSNWQGSRRPSWWNDEQQGFGGSGFNDPFFRNMDIAPSNFFDRGSHQMSPSMGDIARLGAMDIHESDSSHVFKVDCPGLNAGDVKVQVKDGNMLTISGSRERKQEDKDDKDQNRQYYRQERSFGSFNRTFRLPENCDPKNIAANVDAGVLTVTIPKLHPGTSSQIPIAGQSSKTKCSTCSSCDTCNPRTSTSSNNYPTSSSVGQGSSNIGGGHGGGYGSDINVGSRSGDIGGSNMGGGLNANQSSNTTSRDYVPSSKYGSSTQTSQQPA